MFKFITCKEDDYKYNTNEIGCYEYNQQETDFKVFCKKLTRLPKTSLISCKKLNAHHEWKNLVDKPLGYIFVKTVSEWLKTITFQYQF